ncbi:hypothetical protein [Halobacteriaceae bacterium SHR40]|uniref:hypothetical protein n=1 Tax=Halovenus amylolytica TaxID=2500550 RepID=UPI000FE36974
MAKLSTDRSESGEQETLVTAYRHDAHKFTGRAHEFAPETLDDIPVNQSVPYGADGDAAALSRPSDEPTQTVTTHETPYRLSLLDGASQYEPATFSKPVLKDAINELLTKADTEALHEAWLTSTVASGFNESSYYPYTSLKYHTLLVAALCDLYREGHQFEDVKLVIDPAETIIPHRTIYSGEEFTLRLDTIAHTQPAARLGSRPWRSWASVWSRLDSHPLQTNSNREEMMLDANLRRICSWSTALQYIEDFRERVK